MPITRTKNRQQLGYKLIVTLLVYLVIVPTVLLLFVGIVLMTLGSVFNLLFGILTISFVFVLVTGIVLVLVFVRREANLSELQADFVSKVSHELRTPLTAVRLFVETLERSQGDPETQARCLEALSVETERLTRRIERLLDWGRMEAGRRQYELLEQPVADAIDAAIESFSPLRSREDLTLKVDVAKDLPLVLIDRHALVDALVNLLSNALKYGGSPPVVLLKAYAGPKGGVIVEVTDNGHGIERIEHGRIFEKFYRIDDRLSRAREGSGLGLAIVKHIVRAHNARISVESAKGHGATFRIALPPLPPGVVAGLSRVASDRPSAKHPREIPSP